jgi:peptide/nickel transport system substrate-binding protein
MSKRTTLMVLAAAAAIGMAGPAVAQKSVTVVREIDTDRYDPHKSTARSGAEVMFMIGDTLVNLDFDMKTLKPGIAKSWSVSPDGLTYTFKLRDDVSFCSGKKLVANDVVASYERWLDPATKGLVKWRMGTVDKITAPAFNYPHFQRRPLHPVRCRPAAIGRAT